MTNSLDEILSTYIGASDNNYTRQDRLKEIREAKQALITYIETEIIGEYEKVDGLSHPDIEKGKFTRNQLRDYQRAILNKLRGANNG